MDPPTLLEEVKVNNSRAVYGSEQQDINISSECLFLYHHIIKVKLYVNVLEISLCVATKIIATGTQMQKLSVFAVFILCLSNTDQISLRR